ncbi:flagellar hook-associated protein FlgL [Glutamicibacter creatinolyticus]|uniref:flagellar hook-associated protein FlgL n=1 Tax=Glutamicibacter creatinolyticus TaxID=162496 RepID=UPI0033F9AE48
MTRITTAALSFNTERNLQAALSRLANVQDKVGTRREINRPSDDPSGTANAIEVRSQQRQNVQFVRNVDDALGWLSTTDMALAGATDVMQRVRDVAVKGSNDGALSSDAKEALARELEQLRAELVSAANTQYRGRHVFAGSSDATSALDGDWQFTGSSPVERRIGSNTQVRVDSDGAAVFGEGVNSVFALIDAIAADLRAGTNISGRINEVDDRLQQILGAHTTTGASHATILSAKEALAGDAVTLEARRAGLEDVDLAGAILQLKTQEVAYQAALSAASRALLPSLMDFLR